MKILITAGNTLVPIDRVRCITNIFTGRTGARIALEAIERGHEMELLTSRPETVDELGGIPRNTKTCWGLCRCETFEALELALQKNLATGRFDALIHCAAVNDFRAAGIYTPAPTTNFDSKTQSWRDATAAPPTLVECSAGKIKSDKPELWLRLAPTPKLIDRVRTDWKFRGILVKFKLEVEVSDQELLEVAERSRLHSAAELMMANTLEGAYSWAFLGPIRGKYERIGREELASRLLEEVERLHAEKANG